jgi:hypothetical protein
MSEFVAKSVVTSLNAVSATGLGTASDLDGLKDEFALVVVTTGSPTFSLQLQGSLDNVNWYSLGSAVTTAGETSVTGQEAAYIRGDLTALSGGTLTAEVGFGKI